MTWLAQPLESLAIKALDRGFELAGMHGQSLHLQFQNRQGGMPGHQGLSVALVAAFRTEVGFTTDPSCLNQFAAELDVAVDDYR